MNNSYKKEVARWLKLNVLPPIGAFFLKCLSSTWRIHYSGYPSLVAITDPRRIVCVWHGRLILTACILKNYGIRVMVSDHDDGEIITRVVTKLGFKPVRGSSTRGGVKATLAAVDAIKKGEIGGMLPDGPTGPRHQAKLGSIWLAQECEASIIPVSGSAKRAWIFPKSWDKHLLPKPFAKVVFHIGEPIRVENSTSSELRKLNRNLEQTLSKIESDCDLVVGQKYFVNSKL